MLSDYFTIHRNKVIETGMTTPPRGRHEYIIYETKTGEIRVNTYFRIKDDQYKCCRYYDRHIADSYEEYKKLSHDIIESQAYGSWMDGAR